ncbi:hypothetical protein [Haladaptatus halobius]|uniref:hypothetical protein n=1 Tax=Haladaptatus halobius TaxID=2884875 RepID=UPI001D0A8BDD|nr:hypothetical protein [Haladaptatus halobius]
MTQHTRRQFLRIGGATTIASVGGVGFVASAQTESSNGWSVVESPTKKTLNGVVDTAEGPFAVGGGGDVLARRQSGWEKVVEFGPQARSRPLTGGDASLDFRYHQDGERARRG